MSNPLYLITGATGTIGSLAVLRLLDRGHRPGVFVRDAGKARVLFGDRVDAFTGDLRDMETLRPALSGVDALLLINIGPDLAARDEAAARVAQAAGVKRLVKLSSIDAQQNVGTGAWHAQGEAAIRSTGIPFTFVQPSGFMVNALWWASSIKAEGLVRSSTGAGRIPFIHSDDIADVLLAALTDPRWNDETLAITGPEALSYGEMTRKIGAAIGKPLRFETISDEEERRVLEAAGESGSSIEAHLSIYRAIRAGRLAHVTDTVARVLGRPPISFDQWAQENAAAFSPTDSAL